ncbi:MAG: hypothetical protein IJF59_05370, partial [Clostridia bacterium]|nr:hypothetical protein [Clostridia bacterium]
MWHAPFCALFVRSEGASCTCEVGCSEELVNDFCEVCYFEGVASCTGVVEAAAVYGASVSNRVLTVSGELTPADYAEIYENLGRIDELVIENGVLLDLSGHSTIADVTNNGTLAGGSFSGTVTNDGLITGGSYTFDIVNNGSITGVSFSGNLGNYGSISGSTAVSGELYNMQKGSISGLYYTGTLFDQKGSGTVEVYHKVNGTDMLLPCGAPALALLSGGAAGVKFYVGDTAVTGEDTIPVTYTTYVGEYPISLRQIGSNGSVALDKTRARAGETVTLGAEIDEGYELSLSGADFTEAEGGYSFTMPAATVSVVAKIKPVGGYMVNVAQCIGGEINPDKGGALTGETVSFTATPATGYALESVSVSGGEGAVEVTENADGSYSFAMPEGDVTLGAVFKQLSYNIGIADEYAGVTNVEAVEGKWSAVYGQTITIGFHKPHYIPVSVTVKGSDGTVAEGSLSGSSYSFTMPAVDVSVSAEYEAIKYSVERQAPSKYGEVQLSAYSAAYGDTVTVTALPGAGWKITPQVSVQGGEALELIA